jgi:hypothetical protein
MKAISGKFFLGIRAVQKQVFGKRIGLTSFTARNYEYALHGVSRKKMMYTNAA